MEMNENTPRRRTSTAIQDRESIDSEELSPDAEAAVFLPDSSTTEKSKNAASYHSLCKILLATIATLVLFLVILFKLAAWGLRSEPVPVLSGESGSDDQYLAIQLHPEDHIYREPKVHHYQWVISWGVRAPDGVRKNVYLINSKWTLLIKSEILFKLLVSADISDEFPGPTIETRTGDTLIISLTNALKEGVSMHWHGLHMRGANDMDGAVGFTQSPISPGKSFNYIFTIIDQDGTFWYHAHSHVQRGDGLYGGLIVHKPATREESTRKSHAMEDEGLLLVGDWFHRSSKTMLEWYTSVRGFGNEV